MSTPNRKTSRKVEAIKKGSGIVNTLINKLPFELHIPAGLNKKYSYCGPGTKLQQRLKRGDPGINKLDEACKEHDIAYQQSSELGARHLADKILASKASERFRSSDASFGEKAAALGVSTIMKVKTKLGMGSRIRKITKPRKGGALSFKSATSLARRALRNTPSSNVNTAIKIAMNAIKKNVKKGGKMHKSTRVIPIPKRGGFLPLIPLFAGLSALGALSGGAASIVKAVNTAKAASESLKEAQRHNQAMESITMGKGLYLKPYKSGLGLFLAPPARKSTYQ